MMRNVTCKTTPVQRSRGHSAVGGAAYRAGQNIKARGQGPDGTDKWFRYSPKAIVVREAFIMTPPNAPDYASDRSELWNRVEEMETRKNSRLGRDLHLGLAYELSHDEQRALVEEFAQREFVEKGFIVDVAIHNYGRTIPAIGASEEHKQRIREWAKADLPFLSREDAQEREDVHVMEMRNRDGAVTGYKLYQPHAHLRVTPRPVVNGAFDRDKYAARDMNRHDKAMEWRYEWPKLQNTYLERAGADVRVTSTSTEEDQFPDIRFLGKGAKSETRTIEQRAEQLSDEQRSVHEEKLEAKEADELFRQMHNDSIKETFVELENPQGSQSAHGERTRVALWWHNTSARFNQWRFDFREKADEWRDRFEQHKERIRQVIGWHPTPSDLVEDADPTQDDPPPRQEPRQ
jgi:hypothetical protein